MQRVRRSEAITRTAFESALADWGRSSREHAIGEGVKIGRTPWIYVRHEGRVYHANADTKRVAVEAYLGMLRLDPSLAWTVVPNAGTNRTENKVAFGHTKRRIPGFYLYAAEIA